MNLKDRVRINIDSVAFGGEGVGRLDHIVVFVPFSAPGDELEIEVTQIKKTFLRGRILKIIKPSSFRVKPLCRYYERCGGCCYQHLDYPHQLAVKKKQVEDAFRKIGKVANPPVADVLASPVFYNYRGKARYHARVVSGRREIGFLDISGGKLVDIENCRLMDETINEKVELLRKNDGRLNDEDLAVWSGPLGEEPVAREVNGKTFLVPRDGFFQANLYLTDKLVDEICRRAAAVPVNTVIDAYCGCGLFSVFLAPFARRVVGIEMNNESIKHARINAERFDVKNADFICGDVRDVLRQKSFMSEKGIDLMVIDPPRVGCDGSVLEAMVDLQPGRIIYISCNPATQARDVRYLSERGYDLKSLLPLDMFPQTEHIEAIGLMEKIKNSC